MTSEKKLKEIKKIISKYFELLETLPTGGKIDEKTARRLGIPKEIKPIIDNAYKYGRLSGRTKSKIAVEDIAKQVSKDTIKNNFVKLSQIEATEHVENLLTKTRARLTHEVIEQFKKDFIVVNKVFEDEKMPKRWMATELRKVTGEFKQDWDMVVRTELMNNKLNGEAHEILSGNSPYSDKGEDTIVFKRPNPDACPHCIKHYLEKDKVTPKLFKLSELMANGTNYGKKVADWKPTLGVLHPHCQCQLGVMPDGCKFDENGNIVIDKKGGKDSETDRKDKA